MSFLIYRDTIRAEDTNHYPYVLGMALNQYIIDTKDHSLHYITKPLFKYVNCYTVAVIYSVIYTVFGKIKLKALKWDKPDLSTIISNKVMTI